ncbi:MULTISPECIES: aconitase family protein [Pseudoalteromonas]|uniref:Uncharacterized protein n=1 Tax=Pseudoalteromonas amylolytica TaxID=1859457 RepID=A0A1S1MP28_9GAMM|nr:MULTISPECIES: aconitase family protein [Pseudoalteromonas]OHU84893.1 hypothetical protein BFC16_19560 [Pseudoalteromonas sp. JW3]OHU90156.1 hypothetical protein BET10_15415 [Pseudoalteromonas amylolytica]
MSKNYIDTNGRAFVLTNTPQQIEVQINNQGVKSLDEYLKQDICNDLLDNISTDEITPGWCCFWYDEKLADFAYLGLRQGVVHEGDIKRINPCVIVSGNSKGCGSSREHSPYAEKALGAKVIVAKSFEKIYYQNCINIGLFPTTDFSILEYVFDKQPIPLDKFSESMSRIDREIIYKGGLFKFNIEHHKNKQPITVFDEATPLNLLQKIVKNRLSSIYSDHQSNEVSFCHVDLRFSHEYVSPMCISLFESELGHNATLTDPTSIVCFQDHLTFLEQTLPAQKQHLAVQANRLIETQLEFVKLNGLTYYSGRSASEKSAICHNAVMEDLALPGQVIIGTDSHTCTAGALGCFAFGVGATDMANAWFTKDVKFTMPKTVAIELVGELPPWCTAKDIVLQLLTLDFFKHSEALGCVLLYKGDGIKHLSIDERATIANMAVEMGATTAIFEVDSVTLDYIEKMRDLPEHQVTALLELVNDDDAQFDHQLSLELSSVSPSIALPGDPRNVHSLEHILAQRLNTITVDRAYAGSCTGGKNSDMDLYAQVLLHAKKLGLEKPDNIDFYIQFGSDNVKSYCEEKNYISLFESFGAKLIDPSCGACINAGPGVSKQSSEVTISSQNRNFPGRSGPGSVYLASPTVVAIAAVAGKLMTPSEFFSKNEH